MTALHRTAYLLAGDHASAEDLANNEGAYAVRRLDADFEIAEEFGTTSPMSISPDGSRIAWVELDGTEWSVVDVAADGSRAERRTPLPDLAAAPDDQYVARLDLDGTVERVTGPGTELAEGMISLGLATS